MITIREATAADFRAIKGFVPAGIRLCHAAVRGHEPIALAGIMRDRSYVGTFFEEEGRWMAFFEAFEKLPKEIALHAILHFARGLKAIGEEVWVQCDDSHPTAEKFCRLIGFQPTDEFSICWRDNKSKRRMWKWQASAQSSA